MTPLIIVGVLVAPLLVYFLGYGLGRLHRFLIGRDVTRSQADYHAGA